MDKEQMSGAAEAAAAAGNEPPAAAASPDGDGQETDTAAGEGAAPAKGSTPDFDAAETLLEKSFEAKTQDEFREGAKAAFSLVEGAPNEARTLVLRSKLACFLNDDEASVKLCLAALAKDPLCFPAEVQIAAVLEAAGRHAEAADFLQSAAKTAAAVNAPPNKQCDIAAKLAHALAENGQAAEAEKTLRAAQAEHGASFALSARLGNMLVQEGNRKEEALAALREAAALQEAEGPPGRRHAVALYNLGVLLQESCEHAEALAVWRRLAEVEPSNYRVHAKCVQCHAALGNAQGMTDSIERVRALHAAGRVRENFFVIEQIRTDKGLIMVLERFEFSGAFKCPLVKMGWEGDTPPGAPDYVQLASYDSTNQVFLESQGKSAEGRLYHLDAYFADASHETLGMMHSTQRPHYLQYRACLLQRMLGDKSAVQSSFDAGTQSITC